jgi:hypothetical protein
MSTKSFSLMVCILVSWHSFSQPNFPVPTINSLHKSIENFYINLTQIQTNEVHQTKRFRWLSYLPHPGYSPFTGGFSFSLNLSGPLQEVRLNQAARNKIEFIQRNNGLLAHDLKNSITIDHNHILNLITEYQSRNRIDSVNVLTFNIAQKKYNQNELTPTEFLMLVKAHEEYMIGRRKEANAITEGISSIIYKAKMPVAANNEHLNISHP